MDEPYDRKLFATFEKREEFTSLQREFLRICSSTNDESDYEVADTSVRKITLILYEYQEQPYLLDPFLEQLVVPVVECLKSCILSTRTPEVLEQLANLLYSYIRFRGYKTITRFFPHEIADLSIVLNFFHDANSPAHEPSRWPLRYVTLLWLSLICMLPFDLVQFDEPESLGKTASDIESVAKTYLDKAGIEREGAAILLSRLYARKDTTSMLPPYLNWMSSITTDTNNAFICIGTLQVACELAKSAPSGQILPYTDAILDITHSLDTSPLSANNTLIRKLRIKLVSRILLRLMPTKRNMKRIRGKDLRAIREDPGSNDPEDEDMDVPEEVETVLEVACKALQDKDTIVRYSAAKAVARISERLPTDFAEQVLDTVLQLFSIHSIGAATLYDMPSIAEATWHGACLACAEIARRGVVPDSRLGELIDWMRKALYFDIRKGAHSVGSSVRDAASYVLWSLARAQSIEGLQPFADVLAQALVTVSVFDREVHIRRASSAAFQEYVGRTSLFPHGIDVLRKTDFYAVGTRRNAFLSAAPDVAQHEVYQGKLIEHLLLVTVRHWDPAMRTLGAQSLRLICQLDLRKLSNTCIERVTPYLTFPDVGDVHGALACLTELAIAYEQADQDEYARMKRREIFSLLIKVPLRALQSHRNELLTASACQLIAHSISHEELQNQSPTSHWRSVIDFALKSASVTVQESVAEAMASVSHLVECSTHVKRFIQEGKSGTPAFQQSICRVLGVLDYNAHPHGLLDAINFILRSVDRSSPDSLQNVEARRNAYCSLPQILDNVLPRLTTHLSPEVVCSMFDALVSGLEDYTTDERGDVGSWIRIACVKGLADFICMLITNAPSVQNCSAYLPIEKYHIGIAGILKQGVERLDNVRQQAGEQFMRVLTLPVPAELAEWRVDGESLVKDLFLGEAEGTGWNECLWLFPRVIQLLAVKRYRHSLLAGLVMSASSKTDSTQRPVSASLVSYAQTLPVRSETGGYDLQSMAEDLLDQAKCSLASNNVVVPILQTFNVLLEADVFEAVEEDEGALHRMRELMSICSRNVARLKSVQRISMSMHVIVNLIPIHALRESCAAQLPSFLGHSYPKIRIETAEYLYLVLQSKDVGIDTDQAEEILLDTEWSAEDMSKVREAAQSCAKLLSVDA